MSSTFTRKSALLAIALGFTALGATTNPAAAGFSPYPHAYPITPYNYPHPVMPMASKVIGSTEQKPIPQMPGAVSQKPDGTKQKASATGPYSPTGPQTNSYPMAGQKPQAPYYQKGSTAVSGCASSIPGACGNSGTPQSPPSPPQPSTPTTPQTTPQTPGPNVSIQLPPVVIRSQQPVTYPQPVVVQRQPAAVQVPVANTTTSAQQPCNCLTKQYLDDGSVLFRDLCTREAAIATAAELKAQAQAQAQSAAQ